jgi:hypothetical protein
MIKLTKSKPSLKKEEKIETGKMNSSPTPMPL